MTDDPAILRAAKLLIAQYGERADLCANRRSKELLLRGYGEASKLWDDVVRAIHDLERDYTVS